MMKNEIYNLKGVPQFVAVIMNIENQSFLYKIEENAYIPISDNISIYLRGRNASLSSEEGMLVANIKNWINKPVKSDFDKFIPKTFILKLIPTLRCNLRCSYCFSRDKNTDFDMSIETAKVAIDFFLNHFHLFSNCTYIVDLTGAGELS